MKRLVFLFAGVAIALTGSPSARGSCPPSDDSYVGQNDCTYTYGSEERLRVRNRWGAGHSDGWEVDSALRFDLSEIPQGTEVVAAHLFLYYYASWDNNPAGRLLVLQRLLGDWDEGTLQWCNLPERAPAFSAVSVVPSSFGWMEWDVTADVRAFVEGAATNFGWFLSDPTPWNFPDIPQTWFYSKEHETDPPYLEVTTGAVLTERTTWGQVKMLYR